MSAFLNQVIEKFPDTFTSVMPEIFHKGDFSSAGLQIHLEVIVNVGVTVFIHMLACVLMWTFVSFPEPDCRCSLPEKTAFLEKTPGLMSGPTDLGNGSILEPVLRLRKGYMPDVAEQKHDDHNQSSDQGPLLVKPPISSEQEKVITSIPKLWRDLHKSIL